MKRFLLSLFFLVPLYALAQSNFQKGSVVTTSKEVFHGYIDYKERSITPQSFRFRTDLKGETQVYDRKNITAVMIDGMDAYEVFAVDITTSTVQIGDLSVGPDLRFRRDTVFLKVLQAGKNITLYAYKDQVKLRYYIKEKDASEPVELSRQMYLQNGNVLYTGEGYRRQLLAAGRRLNPGKENILSKSLNYNESDLISASALINDQDLAKSKFSPFRFFAGLGMNATKAEYGGYHPLNSVTSISKTFYLPALTAGVDLFSNPAIGKVIYRAELSVLMAKNEISSTSEDAYYAGVKHSFDQVIVAFSPQIIYNVYNKEKLKVFIGLGFAINYAKYSNNLYSIYNSFRNETDILTDKIDLESFYISIPTAVGITLNKKIELSLSYSFPSAVTGYNSYSVSTQRTRIGVNYLFSR